jgi:transposase
MQPKVTKDLFKEQSFYVGIDFHKKSWKVAIFGEQYEHKTMSQNPDPHILAQYLNRTFPGGNYYAVYEAGFSGFTACRELQELGINCMVIHPADVPTSQKEKQQKTDKADSRKLARSLRADELTAIDVPERELEADRALMRQRFRIVKDIARTKNRVKSLLYQFGIIIPERYESSSSRHWSKNYIDWLKAIKIDELRLRQVLDNYIEIGTMLRKELLVVNRQVKELTILPEYQNNFRLLLTIPGIGITTAMTVLVQLGDIRRFKRLDDLCNYIGLVPKMYASGEKMVTGKMINRGRKELKIMMIEASWEAIRKDPALMIVFNKLSLRMNKNKAIIRIARKLISRVRYVLTNQQAYELGVII